MRGVAGVTAEGRDTAELCGAIMTRTSLWGGVQGGRGAEECPHFPCQEMTRAGNTIVGWAQVWLHSVDWAQ